MKNSYHNKLIAGMLVVLLTVIILGWFIYNNLGLYPMRNLLISQIESITIYSLSLEKEVLSEDEKKQLLSYLKRVELRGKERRNLRTIPGACF